MCFDCLQHTMDRFWAWLRGTRAPDQQPLREEIVVAPGLVSANTAAVEHQQDDPALGKDALREEANPVLAGAQPGQDGTALTLDALDALLEDWATPDRPSTEEFLRFELPKQQEYLLRTFGVDTLEQSANWAGTDLLTVKEALERIPDHDKHFLHSVVFVRDANPPATDPNMMAGTHVADPRNTAVLDTNLPEIGDKLVHVHLFGTAFGPNGPVEIPEALRLLWAVAHEIGHVRLLALTDTNAPAPDELYRTAATDIGKVKSQLDAGKLGQAAQTALADWVAKFERLRARVGTFGGEVTSDSDLERTRWPLSRWETWYLGAVAALTLTHEAKAEVDAARTSLKIALQSEDANTQKDVLDTMTQAESSLGKLQEWLKRYVLRMMEVLEAAYLAKHLGFTWTTAYGHNRAEEWYAETYALYVLAADMMKRQNEGFHGSFKRLLKRHPRTEPLTDLYASNLPPYMRTFQE